MKKSKEEITHLERNTVGQSRNPLWKQERSLRLTASHFGRVCKLQAKTSCVNTVKEILYSTFTGNRATHYGLEHEPIAIKEFESEYNLEVRECGLFIDQEHPFLAASPDEPVNEDAIIEVKCPLVIEKIPLGEAIRRAEKLPSCTEITMARYASKEMTSIFIKYKGNW